MEARVAALGASQERYRGSNLVIEARAVPHSSKSMQIWRGAFAYLIRRNWREALTRAAQNKSAAQLAYCVVSFSERMVPSLAAMERQSKKASKQRAEEGRPSGRPSRAKRPRVVRMGLQNPELHSPMGFSLLAVLRLGALYVVMRQRQFPYTVLLSFDFPQETGGNNAQSSDSDSE